MKFLLAGIQFFCLPCGMLLSGNICSESFMSRQMLFLYLVVLPASIGVFLSYPGGKRIPVALTMMPAMPKNIPHLPYFNVSSI